MAKQQYKIVITQDEDGYFVGSVPSLPGCYTQAKSLPLLNKRLREAIALCLDVAKTDSIYRKRISRLSNRPSFVGLDVVEV